jgi:hypothetical protein
MGKHKHTWPGAKKLCRLNQNDIDMAKKLGLGRTASCERVPTPNRSGSCR